MAAWTAARRSVSTTPASAVAVGTAVVGTAAVGTAAVGTTAVPGVSSTASTRFMCRDRSRTRPSPIAFPAIEVPPPRAVAGTPRRWQTAIAAATSDSVRGNTTAAGTTR